MRAADGGSLFVSTSSKNAAAAAAVDNDFKIVPLDNVSAALSLEVQLQFNFISAHLIAVM